MAIIGPIAYGKTELVMAIDSTIAGSKSEGFSIESDSVLVSLYVDSVAGSLNVIVYTLADDGKEVDVITFPTISSPTTELLLKKAAVTMSRIRVVATYDDGAKFEIRARAIAAGESSVRILGATTGTSSQIDVGTSPTVLFPVSLDDRNGLIIKNWGTGGTGTQILYIGYSAAEATSANGYPLFVGESMGIDLAGGESIYAVSSTGTVDVRLMESGG